MPRRADQAPGHAEAGEDFAWWRDSPAAVFHSLLLKITSQDYAKKGIGPPQRQHAFLRFLCGHPQELEVVIGTQFLLGSSRAWASLVPPRTTSASCCPCLSRWS